MNCKETAGILFPRPCDEPQVAACARCKRPVCAKHLRRQPTESLCVSCLKTELPSEGRGSPAWVRDDPYFYWYAPDRHRSHFTSHDRSLFDRSTRIDDDAPHSWTGS